MMGPVIIIVISVVLIIFVASHQYGVSNVGTIMGDVYVLQCHILYMYEFC